MVPFVVTDNSINLTLKGKMYVCQKSHANFEAIKKALKGDEITEDDLLNLVDVKKSIETFSSGKVKIEGEVLTYDGRELSNCLTKNGFLDFQLHSYHFQEIILTIMQLAID
jgi:hypothetical protein